MTPKRLVFPLALLLTPAILGGGCSSTEAERKGPVARFALSTEGAPAFLDVPFPSDVYLEGGRIGELPRFDEVVTKNGDFLRSELKLLDGFSRVAYALFYLDDASRASSESGDFDPPFADIDPASLPLLRDACTKDDSAVFLLDLEASDAAAARIPCRTEYHDDTPFQSKTRPVLALGPARGIVLEEGHKYAAVVTSRVKTKEGKALGATADFKKLLGGERSGRAGDVYGPALDKAKALLGNALASDGAEIVALAPFTTNTTTREIFAMREALEDAPLPTLKWDAESLAPMGAAKFVRVEPSGALPEGFTASLDAWLGVVAADAKLPDGTDDPDILLPVRAHDQLLAFGTAAFDAINYLDDKPGGYDEVGHAIFTRDASGKPIPNPKRPTSKVWISFAIPNKPMPPEGFPVVIVQHGLSGSRDFLVALANTFAAKGWASVAIDSVTFGARAIEPKYRIDNDTDYQDAPGATYKGPDGISDRIKNERAGSFELFGGLKDVGAIRDQFRQAELDTSQLVRLLRSNPDLGPLRANGVTPKLDASKIVYLGESLGAIQGSAAAAIEPNVKAWTVNTAGGGLLLELAAHSAIIGVQLTAAGGLNFGFVGDKFSDTHPLVSLIQTVVDAGDPLLYAPFLVKAPRAVRGQAQPRNVLQTEVVYDEIVPNESNEALAFAAGFGLATPNVGSNAGVKEPTDPASSRGLLPFVQVEPSEGAAIRNTPQAGVTSVLVQVSPGQHGALLVRSIGSRNYAIPYARFDRPEPYRKFPTAKQPQVRTSYRALQSTVVGFFEDALAAQVPRVQGFVPPVRDFDGDGTPDDKDPDYNDPAVK
jgi:hypothetical protein